MGPLQKDEVVPKVEGPQSARGYSQETIKVPSGSQTARGPREGPPRVRNLQRSDKVYARARSWDPSVQPLGLRARFERQESAWTSAEPDRDYSWRKPSVSSGAEYRETLRGPVHETDRVCSREQSLSYSNEGSSARARSSSWNPDEVPTGAAGWTSAQRLRRSRQQEQACVDHPERIHDAFAHMISREETSSSPLNASLGLSSSASSLRSASFVRSNPNPFVRSSAGGLYRQLLPAPPSEAAPKFD